jgi:hypothetical protein
VLQEVERLEAEKRHLVEVLAAHAPSCAKRPRRASSGANNPPSGGDENEYCLPTDNNGHHGSFYPHGPQPELEAVSFPELKYPSEQNALLSDASTAGQAPFLDAPSQTKNSKDDCKQIRHFKSSCSFARTGPSQDQQYFLAAKARCLSYGFQMDNRCVAL